MASVAVCVRGRFALPSGQTHYSCPDLFKAPAYFCKATCHFPFFEDSLPYSFLISLCSSMSRPVVNILFSFVQ
jgi:hypothetical protein